MYRILFEHPLVEAVTGWDFADGMWLKAPSGVIHADNTLKPVYRRLKEMIRGEWWTDVEVCTDENGIAKLEGFKGQYVLENGEKKAELTLAGGKCEEVSLITI